MQAILFLIILFTVCVGGCWLFFTTIGDLLFPEREETYKPPTIHNHYYHNENHLHVTQKELTDISHNRFPSE